MTSAGTDHERFRAWLETIYERVREKLGGDPDQSGDRRYGRCVFSHAANYKPGGDYGEMIFQVRCVDDILKRYRQVHTIDWYSAVDPTKIAEELIAACKKLEQ